ncbi:MAG: MATE family efflux transporter [Ruminococcaceae bacterium]|nr:MATE family efflux transporter [Oscillospiraceae bacterium]
MSDTLTAGRTQRRNMMLDDNVAKVIIIIAIPMIISMLVDSLYNIADTYFVSRLGKSATAAVGVNDSLTHFIRSASMGFGVGASSYISRLLGAKQDEEACRVGTTTLFTSMVILSAFAALAYIFIDPLVTLLGATESSKPYAMDYARFILLSVPFTAGEVSLSHMLRAEGSTKLSMIGMTTGCAVNVVLDPIFITGFGLEVAGAAIATTLSKVVSFLMLLWPFLRRRTMLEVRLRYFTPKWRIYKEVARMGIPTFLRTSMMTISGVVMNNYAGSFSDSALAAVSVANKCTRLVGSGIMGFGQGFQPVAGYCWGAKRYRRVNRAFWVSSGIGSAMAIVIGSAMAIFSPQLVAVFAAADPDIISIGTLMIRSQCSTMVLHMWVMIVNSLFQALGRAIPAAILGLSRQVICLLPALVVLCAVFGVTGLAISQAVADLLSLFIAVPMVIKITREILRLAATEDSGATTLPAAESEP